MKKILFYTLLSGILCLFVQGAFAQTNATSKALDLMKEAKFREAIASLDKAAAKGKDLYAVYKLRATLKQITGDFAGAVEDYSAALEQKSDDGELYEQRAMMRMVTRADSALILKDLDSAIAYGRKAERIYAQRAMIRRQSGDPAGAVADYETAISLKPDFAMAYIGLAGIYTLNEEPEKAIQVLETFVGVIENSGAKTGKVNGVVIATETVDVPTLSDDKKQVTQSSMLIAGRSTTTPSSMTSEEINRRTEALEQKKNTAAAYANLASLYERAKNYEKAAALVEKSLKIDAAEFPAYETRGKLKVHDGDYAGAIADFDKAISLMPKVPSFYLERGIAKLLAGKDADAQSDFDKYLQLFPNGKATLDRRIEEAKQK